jgi:hypothetical protein
VLIGFANGDDTVDYRIYAVPTIAFWVENNGCASTTQVNPPDVMPHVCNNPAIQNCSCERYDDCLADLVVCTWDGEHQASEIGQPEAAWWFNQVDQHDANPTLYQESFPGGVPTHVWALEEDPGFSVAYLPAGRLHMNIPHQQVYAYNGRAEAQLTDDYWDMPIPHDFSVGVTVTDLQGDFSEARLQVAKGGQSVEVRTSFNPQRGTRAQVYVNGAAQGSAWAIKRSGSAQLTGGACWMIRAEPITDLVTVYERGMHTWPNCAGRWNARVTVANPFLSLDMHDEASYPLAVSLGAWRNTNKATGLAPGSGYIRFDDVSFSRSRLGPGTLP